MYTQNMLRLALATGMALFAATAPVWAGDADGDGVDDATDLCNNTPAGTAVDAWGRPWGDLDQDCDTDLDDYALFQQGFTGPLSSPIPSNMTLIPGGTSVMGDTFHEGDFWELPVHTVHLTAFYMDRYAVTNEQYAAFLNSAYQQNQIEVRSGVVYAVGDNDPYFETDSADSGSCIIWDNASFSSESGRENQPVVRVAWYGAAAYCNWRSVRDSRQPCYDPSTWSCDFAKNGYRLPTEAEWEKAARGGIAGLRFPWSDADTIQHSRANYNSTPDYSYDTSPTRGYHPDYDDGDEPYTNPVDSFAPNGYGLYGMAGNVWEWCNDWYDGNYYANSDLSDPRGPATGNWRVLRGGSWDKNAKDCRVAARYSLRTDLGRNYAGFRCAAGTP